MAKQSKFWVFAGIAGVLCGYTPAALALPTLDEVYRDDASGLVVYKDSEDAQVFWYLPVIELYSQNGSVSLTKKTTGKGANAVTSYSFYVVPTLPEDLAQRLTFEIPGLSHLRQLRPVPARSLSVAVPLFGKMATSPSATQTQYIGVPQLLQLSLVSAQASEFELLFKNAPGVPAAVLIQYLAETRTQFLDISLSCKDVATALDLSLTGQYTIFKGDLQAKLNRYVATKTLRIRSKGDLVVPEILNAVIERCFVPARSNPSMTPIKKVRGVSDFEALHASIFEQYEADAEALPDTLPFMGIDARNSRDSRNDGDVALTFRRDQLDRDEVIAYRREQWSDQEEVASRAVFLTQKPTRRAQYVYEEILTADRKFVSTSEAQKSFRSGVAVSKGELWTISASFSLAAESFYGGGRAYYRWDATWPSPDAFLEYRVGSGPWRSVNGRAVLGSDQLGRGEIEFRIQRAALWTKVPESFRKRGLGGLAPGIFEYSKFYPEYQVTISGRRIREVR